VAGAAPRTIAACESLLPVPDSRPDLCNPISPATNAVAEVAIAIGIMDMNAGTTVPSASRKAVHAQ
jgi:hypothetical protein